MAKKPEKPVPNVTANQVREAIRAYITAHERPPTVTSGDASAYSRLPISWQALNDRLKQSNNSIAKIIDG